MQTKLVLLGTGTPNACPNANGPSSAVVVGDRAYLVDFGPGVVRQASAAYFNGVDALRPDLLTVAFCTHLHTDHTAGYPDLIYPVGAGASGSAESLRTKRPAAYDRSYLTGL